MAKARIGELLVEARLITAAQLQEVLAAPRDRRLGEVLVERGLVSEAALTQTLSLQLSVPWVDLGRIAVPPEVLARVPLEMVRRLNAVPIGLPRDGRHGELMLVALDDPTNERALAEIAAVAGVPVRPMIASRGAVHAAIERWYHHDEDATAAPPAVGYPPRTPPPTLAPSAGSLDDELEAMRSEPEAERTPPTTVRRSEPTTTAPHPSAPPSSARRDQPTAPPSLQPSSERLTPFASHTTTPPPPESAQSSEPASEVPAATGSTREVTLLDGTTLNLPAPKRLRGVGFEGARREEASAPRPAGPRIEHLFGALLSLLMEKGLVTEAEFVESLRKISAGGSEPK